MQSDTKGQDSRGDAALRAAIASGQPVPTTGEQARELTDPIDTTVASIAERIARAEARAEVAEAELAKQERICDAQQRIINDLVSVVDVSLDHIVNPQCRADMAARLKAIREATLRLTEVCK